MSMLGSISKPQDNTTFIATHTQRMDLSSIHSFASVFSRVLQIQLLPNRPLPNNEKKTHKIGY